MSRVFKPRTHKPYSIKQCTNIVYLQDLLSM